MPARGVGVLLAVVCLLDAATALAEVQANDFDVNLYGRWWRVLSYFVEDDLLSNPNDDSFLEPEGVAVADRLLYVSGDRDADEADSQLAIYQHPVGGVLTFDGDLKMSIQGDNNGWGPEGIVFNTSGSGYGSASNALVSVERDGTGRVGIIDLDSGKVTEVAATSTPEDVTYLSADASFATLQEAGGPVTVAFHDQSFVPSGITMTIAPSTNGVAAVTAAFASFLTRATVSGESLLTVAKEDPGNAIRVFALDGLSLGPRQDLPVEPRARIPIGGGFYLVKPAFGKVEAIAVDESNEVIYVGDEGNSMVHVLTPGFSVGDFDEDGDVDPYDHNWFALCFTGPDGGPVDPGCAPGDGDVDDDIDSDDWEVFIRNWTGPPADPPACPDCVSLPIPAVSKRAIVALALLMLASVQIYDRCGDSSRMRARVASPRPRSTR